MADVQRITAAIHESARMVHALDQSASTVGAICDLMIDSLKKGNKVLTAGNGGSAAEALHMSEEFVGRFRTNRRSLPAVALTADATALTCIGNDFGFDAIFSRQVEGLGQPGDVLVLFSTSGSAKNLQQAVIAAKARGVKTVGLLGRDGGALKGQCDVELIVPGQATERIQEVHQVVLHLILDAVEVAFS